MEYFRKKIAASTRATPATAENSLTPTMSSQSKGTSVRGGSGGVGGATAGGGGCMRVVGTGGGCTRVVATGGGATGGRAGTGGDGAEGPGFAKGGARVEFTAGAAGGCVCSRSCCFNSSIVRS